MATLRSSLIMLGSVMSIGCGNGAEPFIAIDNRLSECITIQHLRYSEESGIPLGKFTYEALQPTSECGCKSMLNSYSVSLELSDHQSVLTAGRFRIWEPRSFLIPLAADTRDIASGKLHVSIACAQPD